MNVWVTVARCRDTDGSGPSYPTSSVSHSLPVCWMGIISCPVDLTGLGWIRWNRGWTTALEIRQFPVHVLMVEAEHINIMSWALRHIMILYWIFIKQWTWGSQMSYLIEKMRSLHIPRPLVCHLEKTLNTITSGRILLRWCSMLYISFPPCISSVKPHDIPRK